MKSDKEFFLLEYRQCFLKYALTPASKSKHREFWGKMLKAMAKALAESEKSGKE